MDREDTSSVSWPQIMCGAEYSGLVTEMVLVPLFKMALVMVIPNGSTALAMLLTRLHSSPISQPACLPISHPNVTAFSSFSKRFSPPYLCCQVRRGCILCNHQSSSLYNDLNCFFPPFLVGLYFREHFANTSNLLRPYIAYTLHVIALHLIPCSFIVFSYICRALLTADDSIMRRLGIRLLVFHSETSLILMKCGIDVKKCKDIPVHAMKAYKGVEL